VEKKNLNMVMKAMQQISFGKMSLWTKKEKPILLFCWIMTRSEDQLNVRNTSASDEYNWPKKCDEHYYFTDDNNGIMNDSRFINVFQNISDSKLHWNRTNVALNYIYKNFVNDFDWFLKADDYTFVMVKRRGGWH
jgi:glycoprotein-N-acetylgalactosamine 3-beta-galactosyltransferase